LLPAHSKRAPVIRAARPAGASSCSSKEDFGLTWGVSRGPSWTLLKFKSPGGGGSGAGGQLLNYSRPKQDTLIATFSATCKSDEDVFLNDEAVYFRINPQFVTPATGGDFTSARLTVYKRLTRLSDGQNRLGDLRDDVRIIQSNVRIIQSDRGRRGLQLYVLERGAAEYRMFRTTLC
jgi:hypothetical protein